MPALRIGLREMHGRFSCALSPSAFPVTHSGSARPQEREPSLPTQEYQLPTGHAVPLNSDCVPAQNTLMHTCGHVHAHVWIHVCAHIAQDLMLFLPCSLPSSQPPPMGLSPATACTPFGACLSCEHEDVLARGRAEGDGEVEGEGELAA